MLVDVESKAREVLVRYPVKKAAFFGSVLSERFHASSDIDMLIEFLPEMPGLEFFGLKLDLEDELKRSVDLITYNALSDVKPSLKQTVERDAYVFYIRSDAPPA